MLYYQTDLQALREKSGAWVEKLRNSQRVGTWVIQLSPSFPLSTGPTDVHIYSTATSVQILFVLVC